MGTHEPEFPLPPSLHLQKIREIDYKIRCLHVSILPPVLSKRIGVGKMKQFCKPGLIFSTGTGGKAANAALQKMKPTARARSTENLFTFSTSLKKMWVLFPGLLYIAGSDLGIRPSVPGRGKTPPDRPET